MNKKEIRPRVSVLVTKGDKFVLIFRHKNGQDYYAVPGGGIEEGETPQEAAIREIQEELSFTLSDVQFISEVEENLRHDFNFISHTIDTDFAITGPEKNHLNNPEDLFKPEWHSKDSFRRDLPIYPLSARKMFTDFIESYE